MKAKFILDRKSFFARAAIVSMILAVFFRLLGTIGHFSDTQFLLYRFALPASCCILYIICILIFGKKAFWTSFVPVIIGIVFFILRILSDDNITQGNLENLHIVLCIALYILIAVVYSCTVFGSIKTKIFLILIFGCAFAYHVVFEDYPAIAAKSVAAEAIFMELGVLTIILALFFASLGLKKQTTATSDKSKDVVPPIPGGELVHSDPEPETMAQLEAQKEEPAETAPAETETVIAEPAEPAEATEAAEAETAENKEENN